MQIQISLSPRTIVKYLVMGVIFFALVSIGIQICKYVFDYRADWMTLFNLDRELNFPTWYSTLMLGFCSILLKIIGIGKKQQLERYAADWQLLSLIFLLLALDEILSIHEILIIPEVSKALNLPWFLHSMWVIPGMVFVLWFARRYWKFSRHLSPKSQKHFIVAACTYIGGALIMEMIGSYVAEAQGQQNLLYALIANAEEIIEMIGIILFIYGLLYYLSKWAEKINLQISILK
jgi:purine-cytosine permease-like protein